MSNTYAHICSSLGYFHWDILRLADARRYLAARGPPLSTHCGPITGETDTSDGHRDQERYDE